MKISRKYPQFGNSRALFISAGEQEAKFFEASNGEIKEMEGFEFSAPKYSDREGFFENFSGNTAVGSGSVYEAKKDQIRIAFDSKLRQSLRSLAKRKFNQIYLFAPKEIIPEAEKKVKSFFREPAVSFSGNFFKEHPFVLLSKINRLIKEKEREESEAKLESKPEAKKILEKRSLEK